LNTAGSQRRRSDGRSLSAGRFRTFMRSGVQFAEGTERIQDIGTGSGGGGLGVEVGTTLGKFLANPLAIGTRLPIVAENFSKFWFTKFTLHYIKAITQNSAASNGTLIMGVNPDPDAPDLPATVDSVNAVYSYDSNMSSSVYEDMDLDIKLDLAAQNALYINDTTGDNRLIFQFAALILAGQQFAVPDTTLGTWYISYEIRFSQPTVPAPSLTRVVSGIASAATTVLSGTSPMTFGVVSDPASIGGNTAYNVPDPVSGVDTVTGFIGETDWFEISEDTLSLMLPAGAYSVRSFVVSTTGANLFTTGATPTINGVLIGSSTDIQGHTVMEQVQGAISANTVFNDNALASSPSFALQDYFTINKIFALGITVPRTASATNTFEIHVEITRYGAQFDASRPASLPLVLPRFANALIARRLFDHQAQQAISSVMREACAGSVSAELLMIAPIFLSDKRLLALLKAHPQPLIWPAVVAACSWFVTTYGPRLGKAVVEWGIRKIENALEPGKK